MKKKVFSGVQPSGIIHIGNYLGAIKNWVRLQEDYDCIFCIVDLHAITVPQNPAELSQNIRRVAAIYLAAGIDPKKSKIFVQSHRPEHAELAWILNCITTMGELSRMTQFKEKTAAQEKGSVGAGLFEYPVLMAADILLYQTEVVPVGEDQKQHVELTRDLAQRFNRRFGPVFKLPEPLIRREGARIMGLDNPHKKMSKTASSEYNWISLLDEPEKIRQKIKRAVTDSGTEIKFSPEKPAISNLLTIYSEMTGTSIEELEEKYQGKGYAEFKDDLAEAIVEVLAPIQKKIKEYLADEAELEKILLEGARAVAPQAQETLKKVKELVGLG